MELGRAPGSWEDDNVYSFDYGYTDVLVERCKLAYALVIWIEVDDCIT